MIKPKVVTFDIETTPIASYTWDLYPNAISHDSIISDFSLICAAWKYLGDKKVHGIAINKVHNDKEVVKTLRDVLADADIIVGHNVKKFDIKKLKARLVYWGLPPLPKLTVVDTRTVAKEVGGFTSNRLDYLGKHLLGQGKMHVDYELWLSVMKNSKTAIAKMMAYNKVDVQRNEEVYLKLRPYMNNHPHMGVLDGKDKLSCAKCGSDKTQKRGIAVTTSGTTYQRIQCQKCGGWGQVPFKK